MLPVKKLKNYMGQNLYQINHVFAKVRLKIFWRKMAKDKKIPNASIGDGALDRSIDRRGFIKKLFSWLGVGWAAFLGATGGFFTIMIRFLFPNVLFEPPQSFKIGVPEDFSPGTVDLRFKKDYNVWIVRETDKVYALSSSGSLKWAFETRPDNSSEPASPAIGRDGTVYIGTG